MKRVVSAIVLAATLAGAAAAQEAPASALHDLQARESIRELLHAYGRTLDLRDFDDFAKLWTDEATYVGGPGSEKVQGGRAIADFLKGIFASNPSGLGSPNFHIFFNEHIEVSGDRATGASMSAFAAPGTDGRPALVMLASYEDEYVLEDGAWKFAKRVVRGRIPGPAR